MKNHFGRFLLVLAIVGLCALQYFVRKPPLRLGLDLAGGSSITYKVQVADGELTAERMKRLIDVLDKRLNSIGVSEITILPTTQAEIVIELPGRTAEQIKDIKSLVERNGNLEFRIEAEKSEQVKWGDIYREGGVKPGPDKGLEWVDRKRTPGQEAPPPMLVKVPEKPAKWEMEKIEKKLAAASPEVQALQTAYDKAVSENASEMERVKRREELDAARRKVFDASPEHRTAETKYEELRRAEGFTGDQLVRTEIAHQTMQIVVAFEFKDSVKPWFGQFTEKHVGENMAIILDGQVNSAPVIKSKLPGEGIIEGGSGGMGFKESEARDLAIVLESGSTGVRLTLSREESLGPSLGEVAIRHGLWSVIIGFVLVVGLMVFYYRMPGMVANFALVLNLVILLGVMAFFRATFTLPGIAGVVLTLGMAVDANILIFERYREERHRGKNVPEALAAGYDRAFSAIIDTHATTILTAVVLIAMGTGSVKGFGVSLTVGLIASFFTAYFVTRWIFEWAIEKGIAKNLTLGPDKQTPTIDFMGKRKWFTGPSFVLMILGVVAYLVRDDYTKRDLEFVGGQEAVMHLAKGLTPDEADKRIKADPTYEEASVVTLPSEGVDKEGGVDRFHGFRVRAKAQTQKEGEEFVAYLSRVFKDELLPEPFTDMTVDHKSGGVKASLVMHVAGEAPDEAKLKDALTAAGLSDIEVKTDEAVKTAVHIVGTDSASNASAETVKTRIGEALKKLDTKVALSDPFPSKSFLEKSRAEDLYRSAVWAILISLVIQVLYIRLRYANFNYGVAAVVALAHDVPIALGAVSVCDHFGWVYAKVNLVLIAAFLTLIGYSMNDTIVVFDRIREDLGRSKVIRSSLINDAVNQVIVRSIRTSMTVFLVVLVQLAFSHGTGSVLEGFAFVMVVGVVSGTYSSIFIAAPLLLFLPHYAKKLTARPGVTALMALATVVGAAVTLTAPSGSVRMWIAALVAFNVPIHFLCHFFPWLSHKDPDEFIQDQIEAEADSRPLDKPGI